VKLLPTKRISADDNVGKGMDLALSLLVFLGIGYGLDRWLGTKPWMMVSMVLLVAVGQFVKLKYDYEGTMQRLEAERTQQSTGRAS
jgi:F0F1-type ATP synthase assembly protein I